MFKRIFSVLLLFSAFNLIMMPAFANDKPEITSNVIEAEFQTDLDVNKASKNQVVQFRTTEDYYDNGILIPRGTILSGHIQSFKKGRFAYRRAKAHIKIDKMIMPMGQEYNVGGQTKRSVLKGSIIKNTAKGIVTAPVVITIGAVGVCVIIVEAVSIVGILLIGPTTYLLGETAGKLSHGVNYKKHQGDVIKLKINSIKNMQEKSLYY